MTGRHMTLLEGIESSLTLAVLLKDDLSPDEKAFGDLFLNVPRKRKAITRNNTGHFLLIDLPKINQTITGGGKYYNQGSLTIDYKQGALFVNDNQIDPKNPVASITLSPKSNYPFPKGMTLLRGKLIDTENKPVPQASISVLDMRLTAVSDDTGEYFIQLTALDTDNTVILNIKKAGYKPVKQNVPLKKGVTTRAETVVLTKRT
ncbi:MAG: hypothetical protein EHM20_06460 [Alphaproteobacteria bacterium]|nr:MAG: hypothetical protein EHM20_06460 [Alphaproteobacteria bacterium]